MTRPAPTRARGGKWRAWACVPRVDNGTTHAMSGTTPFIFWGDTDVLAFFETRRAALSAAIDTERVVEVEIRVVPREVRARRGK